MFTLKPRGRYLAALLVAAVAASPSLITTAHAATGHPAGVIGAQVHLSPPTQFSSYDVGANPAGTAYIAWISPRGGNTDRMVNLCRLPIGANSCTGGVQTIDSLGISSAAGLRVLVDSSDTVHLIWFHDTPESINGPFGAAIAEATAAHGENLTAAHDIVTNAPSFGQLLTAELGPGGTIWTVSYAGVPTQTLYVWHTGAATADSVHTLYGVGYAQLAFAGATAVMTVEKYGSIGTGPSWATRSSGGIWSSFHPVANTWAVGTNAALETTRHGLRLVTAIGDASYRAVISKWTGSGFTPRHLTADTNNCTPNTHDGWAARSGRLLDASWECDDVTVTNYADAYHAAIVRFPASGTPTFAPQIASGTQGIATVAYTVQGSSGDILRAARVRLPDSTRKVAHKAKGGRVTVRGPRSCLPPVNVGIGWTHHPARHWKFKSGALRLNGHKVSGHVLDGAGLKPGAKYALVGRAVFAHKGVKRRVKAVLAFTTCALS